VPPPGSSAAGEKPHTLDPKADGSMGRASGGQPDGGAKPAEAETTADEQPWIGRRVEFESIKLPNDRVLTPFLEDKPPIDGETLPYRTGYDLEHPDWDGAIARITAYFDAQGKVAGVVATVIHGGDETVVAVEELTPGSLGVKKGDSRPAPDNGGKGKVPSTWDPKPSTSSGSTNEGQPAQDSEPSAGDRSLPGTSQDAEDEEERAPSSSANTQSEYEYLGQGPPRQNEDGSTSQNTLYQRTSDGVYVQIITTTQKDGTQSEEQHCIKDSEEVDCGAGLTDEPTCHTDCARLAMLTDLFVCASGGGGIECGEAFEGVGPADYGDPVDPNGAEPVDTSLFVDPRNDGVTDPVSPGESEETVDGSIRLDAYGTLRDPANPPGTEDSAPAPGVPSTGEAERNPLP
jgi:hypothetical protein